MHFIGTLEQSFKEILQNSGKKNFGYFIGGGILALKLALNKVGGLTLTGCLHVVKGGLAFLERRLQHIQVFHP